MSELLSVFTEKYQSKMNKIINSVIAVNNRTNLIMPAKALWDTGATGTCISKELASKLKLFPIGMQQIKTPSGTAVVNQYKMHIVLNNEVMIHDVTVIDSEIGNQNIDILIGMDIISLGDFGISNFENKTQFSFRVPSQEHVDYRENPLKIEYYDNKSEVAVTEEQTDRKDVTN